MHLQPAIRPVPPNFFLRTSLTPKIGENHQKSTLTRGSPLHAQRVMRWAQSVSECDLASCKVVLRRTSNVRTTQRSSVVGNIEFHLIYHHYDDLRVVFKWPEKSGAMCVGHVLWVKTVVYIPTNMFHALKHSLIKPTLRLQLVFCSSNDF